MDLKFKNKTVIVTAGAKGVGSGISEVFAEEGANLIVDYRSDPEYCERFIEGLREKYGANVFGVQADVSKPDDVIRIFDVAEEKFGRLDVLINNAGGALTTMLWDISLEEWKDCLDNNVTGMFMMCKEFAKRMIANEWKGYIVNVLSKASLTTTTKGRSCYVTNKTAEMGLTKQLAVDLVDKGIIVNGIMPGSVRNSIYDRMSEEEIKARIKRCPTGRLGEPYEFGKMVAFLASEQNQLSVGAPVDFTGGMMLGF